MGVEVLDEKVSVKLLRVRKCSKKFVNLFFPVNQLVADARINGTSICVRDDIDEELSGSLTYLATADEVEYG